MRTDLTETMLQALRFYNGWLPPKGQSYPTYATIRALVGRGYLRLTGAPYPCLGWGAELTAAGRALVEEMPLR